MDSGPAELQSKSGLADEYALSTCPRTQPLNLKYADRLAYQPGMTKKIYKQMCLLNVLQNLNQEAPHIQEKTSSRWLCIGFDLGQPPLLNEM